MSDKNLLRLSQVITTFGPGAMLDLPDHSVVIGGLDGWSRNGRRPIHESRLTAKLRQLLDRPGLDLETPPAHDDAANAKFAAVPARIFPTWFIVQEARPSGPSNRFRRRRLTKWPLDGGRFLDPDDNKRKSAVPVRFVCGCEKGHLDDIDFNAFAHRGQARPNHQLWLEERGTSGDIAETYVACASCDARPRSLYEAAAPFALGPCQGKRPWLGQATEDCGRSYRLLVRTASNAYFPQVMSVISIPEDDDEVAAKIDVVWDDYLKTVDDEDDLRYQRRKFPKVTVALEGLSDDEAMQAIAKRRKGDADHPSSMVKSAEFPVLNAGRPFMGRDEPGSEFCAETLPRPAWAPVGAAALRSFDNLVLVHRLREVVALIGFTRFESIAADVEGEYDLRVESAKLALDENWLPAVDNRGEGIFLSLKRDVVEAWLKQEAVRCREKVLRAGYERWAQDRPGAQEWPGLPYVMLHSLSHLLLTALALDCGYPASSLRERVYATKDGGYGILLYTGTSDAEGTLGGLVQAGRRMRSHVEAALRTATLCSNDPVCSDHQPDGKENDRPLHGAACHGCLLIAETSCERRNDLLDRALVVPTLTTPDAAFFDLRDIGSIA